MKMKRDKIMTFMDSMPAGIVVLDWDAIKDAWHLPVPPTLTVWIRGPKDSARLAEILRAEYPADHWLKFLDEDGAAMGGTRIGDLAEREILFRGCAAVCVNPLPSDHSFEDFQNVVATLRSPGGCPWDRKQTHQSIRDDFLQEAYELIDGLDRLDLDVIREELGDILLHVALQAQMAAEAGEFTMGDVLASISEKIIFRHQHIFNKEETLSVDEVVDRWEKLKKAEREKKEKKQGLLDGISIAMPALSMAHGYQKRAARAGFDWEAIDGVWDKLAEEIAEFRAAETDGARSAEFGDILFTLVNLARWLKIDPETALRLTNRKFADRIRYIEKRAAEMGTSVFDLSPEEKDALWEERKKAED